VISPCQFSLSTHCPSSCFSTIASQFAFIHPPLHLPILPVFDDIRSSTQTYGFIKHNQLTYCKLLVQAQLYNTISDHIFEPSVNIYKIQFPSSDILGHPMTPNFKSGLGMYESDRPVLKYGTDNIKKSVSMYVCKECDSVVENLITTPQMAFYTLLFYFLVTKM